MMQSFAIRESRTGKFFLCCYATDGNVYEVELQRQLPVIDITSEPAVDQQAESSALKPEK
jgi:hypothetical protein